MAYAVMAKKDGIQCRIGYSVEQDAASNTSVLRLTSLEMTADRGLGSYWIVGSLTLNGKKLWGFDNWYSQVLLSTGWNRAGHCPEGAVPAVVEHDAGGNAQVKLRASFTFAGSGASLSYTASVTVNLETVPRVSELEISSGELGTVLELRLDRKDEAYRDTLTYVCGDRSGIIAEKTAQTQIVWMPPLELAETVPEDTVVPVRIRVTTWAGETEIGSREVTVQCRVPDWVVPAAAISFADAAGFRTQYGGYVQLRSRLRVRTEASGYLGSRVADIAVACGSLRGNGADVVFALPDSGQVDVTVTVTDSRGRQCTISRSVTVTAYERPWARISALSRCDAAGNPAPEGAYAKVTFSAGVTALGGRNQASYALERRARDSDSWIRTDMSDFAGQKELQNAVFRFPVGIDKSYDCHILVTDNFETVVCDQSRVQVAFALLDFHRDSQAVGIGQRANVPGTVCVGLDMKLYGHKITDLGEPEEDTQAATKGYVDSRLRALAQRLGINWEEI